MTNPPSIAQLQIDWFKFSDLDRARAVFDINQSGISIRKVAAQLHLSESLLRHLLQALKAPASDRDLARQGKISTNELARRAKAGLRPPKHHEALTIDGDRTCPQDDRRGIAAEQTWCGHRVFTGDDSATAKLMLTTMGGVTEFERAMILERQREGIAKARAP